MPPTLQQRLDRLLREHWKGKIDADRPLVEQAKAGDFSAMESLLVKYGWQVFGVARRIVQQHQDAEEATPNEKYRVVFVLRDIEELSTQETAEILGISAGAVKVRLLRARLMLRERLTRLFGDESTRVAHHDH